MKLLLILGVAAILAALLAAMGWVLFWLVVDIAEWPEHRA